MQHALGETVVEGTPERVVVLDTGELDAVLALSVPPVGSVRTGVSDELPAYIVDAASTPPTSPTSARSRSRTSRRSPRWTPT